MTTEELKKEEIYCLFCVSGNESNLLRRLNFHGYAAFSPQVKQWKMTSHGLQIRTNYLIPGYVFIESQCNNEPDWDVLQCFPEVIRILRYSTGHYALNVKDRLFIEWLKKHNNCIEISQSVQIGTKLTFISGPLKDCSGKIIKINKNRKVVQVSFGDSESLLRNIWCSFQYAEANISNK